MVSFLFATPHSMITSYPDAQILFIRRRSCREIGYREVSPFSLVSRFVAAPERYINATIFGQIRFGIDDGSASYKITATAIFLAD